jgi:Flp pilus assembly pilin Flp
MFVLARRFAIDESGTALEYGLTVAGISFGFIIAMDALDPELRTTLAKVTSQPPPSQAAPPHGAASGFRSRAD